MNQTTWLSELVYTSGVFERGATLVSNGAGQIASISQVKQEDSVLLKNRAVLPGLINAHSHAFQRVIRGRTEYRTKERKDSFWTWREMMYSAANRLTPEDIYDASRMAFLEMALSGITTVGEFHYLHHAPDGKPFADANLLAKHVVRAAHDVGLRIALLLVAYARSGFQTDADPQQARFIETNPEQYLKRAAQLQCDLGGLNDNAWLGLAPHSVRAVPLDYLKQVISYANSEKLMVHMHVAEQPAEVSTSIQEHGKSPVAYLAAEGLLSKRFTAVHAIHVTPEEVSALAKAGARVCACPTTERNLGDGIVPADAFLVAGVAICLGTDSQTQIDLLEDARELESNLRLQRLERSILAPDGGGRSELARVLFDCATISGAESLGAKGGKIAPGRPTDFFTVDLDDPSIAGASPDDLLTAIVFSLCRTAVREVVVGGKTIIKEGRHHDQDDIVERFQALQRRLWG